MFFSEHRTFSIENETFPSKSTFSVRRLSFLIENVCLTESLTLPKKNTFFNSLGKHAN